MKNLHQPTHRRARRLMSIGVVLAVSTLLAACTAAPTNSPPHKSSTAIVFGYPFDLSSWDPALTGDQNSSFFREFVYSSLLSLRPDLSVRPNLVTKWSYNSDKTALSMTLAANQKFSDGAKLDAAAVKSNLLRGKRLTGTAAQALKAISSVSVTSPTQFTIHLNTPDPGLLFNLAGDPGRIVSPKGFGTAKVTPDGSGPYLFDAAASTRGSTYVFTRNPNYSLSTKYGFDKATIKVYPDFNALVGAATSGQVDEAGLPPALIPQAHKAGLSTVPWVGSVSALWISDRAGTITPALGDVRVRRAINYAINGNAILKGIGGGQGVQVTQMFAPGTPAYVASLNARYRFNDSTAKKLLADAGYPNGFTLTMPSENAIQTQLYPVVQQDLKAVGITVKYQPVPASDYFERGLSGDYAAFLGFTGATDNWAEAVDLLSPTGSSNPFHTNDPKVVGLLDQIKVANPQKQAELYKQLNRYVVDQAWFAPSEFGDAVVAFNPKVLRVAFPDNALATPLYTFQPAHQRG